MSAIQFSVDNLLAPDDPAPLFFRYRNEINPQPAYVIMTEDGTVTADYSGEIGNDVPMYVWLNRTLRWRVPSTIRGSCLAEKLQSLKIAALLQRVHDGHTVEWDGNDYAGKLTDDAKAADDALEKDLAYPDGEDNVAVWDVNDFLFGGCALPELWPDSLDAAVERLTAESEREGIYLDGDIRGALLAQAQSYAQSSDPGLNAAHLQTLLDAGEIDAETATEYAEEHGITLAENMSGATAPDLIEGGAHHG